MRHDPMPNESLQRAGQKYSCEGCPSAQQNLGLAVGGATGNRRQARRRNHEDHLHIRISRALAAGRGGLPLVRFEGDHPVRQHHRARRDRHRAHRLGRGLPARSGLSAGLRRRRASGHRRDRAASDRLRPAGTRRHQRGHGRRAEGASVRQEPARHRVLGHPGQGTPACRCAPCWAAASATDFAALPRDLAGTARGDGRRGRRIPGRGLHATSSSRSAATPDDGHRAHPRGARR